MKFFFKALTIELEAAGEIHPLVGQRLHDFADLQATLGANDKALLHYRRAYLVQVTLYGFQDPTVTELRNKMEILSKRIIEGQNSARQKKSEIWFSFSMSGTALKFVNRIFNKGKVRAFFGFSRGIFCNFKWIIFCFTWEGLGMGLLFFLWPLAALASFTAVTQEVNDALNSYHIAGPDGLCFFFPWVCDGE